MLSYTFLLILQAFTIDFVKSDCGCSLNRAINGETNTKTDDNQYCSVAPDDGECSIDKHSRTGINSPTDIDMALIPAGNYQLGTDDIAIPADKEGPKRIVTLKSFYLDKYEVSNKNFEDFIENTNYKTEAESFGDSFVFSLFLSDAVKNELKDFRVMQAEWWYKVPKADWRHPYGFNSKIDDIMDHPVVHVTWHDAKEYCKWRGARLPTEAEWEAACRGGQNDTAYPWGDKLFPDLKHKANIWQGTFPNYNSAKDGYVGTNPVDMFPQNNFGLHNIAGNVWEWTEDTWAENMPTDKVKKGGSYLCHRSYCFRYRCSARSHNTEDSSAGNLGFRCAKSID